MAITAGDQARLQDRRNSRDVVLPAEIIACNPAASSRFPRTDPRHAPARTLARAKTRVAES